MTSFVPYFGRGVTIRTDSHHLFYNHGFQTLAADDVEIRYFSNPLPGTSNIYSDTNVRLEWTASNKDITLYIGETPPDIDNPDYLFSRPWRIVFPDDFLDESLIPDDYRGLDLWIAFRNDTGQLQQVAIIFSHFFAKNTTEVSPSPEPLFFPRHNLYTDNFYDLASEYDPNDSGNPYCFVTPAGPFTGNDGLSMAIPDRGYSISGIVLRRPPVLNSSGIYIADTTIDDPLDVTIGIMAGCGVIAGASTGVFPGRFIPFDTFTIPAGETELKTNILWPVLEGCMLAYTSAEDVFVTAYVDFQPAVNVTYNARTVVQSTGGDPATITHTQGQYNGKPCFQRHFGWAHNLNSTNSGLGGVCMPTLSPRAVGDLVALLGML